MAYTDRLDTLFHALDGSTVAVDDHSWRLHVYSVRELSESVWIQLDVVGTPTYLLTLRQPTSIDAASILRTLSRYLRAIQDPTQSVMSEEILGSSLAPVRRATQAHVATR